jgi:ligand-binding SRPBCC domain-containing protein
MRTFSLRREQFLLLDIDTVFAFFSDAQNLDLLTPPWLHFEILTPPPIDMALGTHIDYKLRLRGIPIRWRSQITDWEAPHRFTDRQVKGPYRLWVHQHRFVAIEGGTLVSDDVTYSVPGGEAVNRLLIRPDLERIFDYRARKLEEWTLKQKRQRVPVASSERQ